MADYPLANYYAAVSAALRAEDIKAISDFLVLMAADGYGHEAEELRRQILVVGCVEGGERP